MVDHGLPQSVLVVLHGSLFVYRKASSRLDIMLLGGCKKSNIGSINSRPTVKIVLA